ncbi:MAG: hypothetical protein FWH22_02140 [Fibromonadales bacterium]|nr:hypothetical protein [Fibromonadales bacterium]
MLCCFAPEEWQYDIIADSRDGKTYKIIDIGDEIWMAENLNYYIEGSVCYNFYKENCEKYGRLYKWEMAKEACPAGWHLPSDEEWTELENFVGLFQCLCVA